MPAALNSPDPDGKKSRLKPDVVKFTCLRADRTELNEIKELLGVAKDTTAIRIAIHGYLLAIRNVYSNQLVIPREFREIQEQSIEEFKKQEHDKGE